MATATTGTALNVAALRSALNDLSDAVPARTPKPVLTNVLLCDGTVTGTNLEVRVSEQIGYDGEPLLIPYSRLKAIVNECGTKDLTLTVKGSSCIVKAGRSEWRLPVGDASEFPAWQRESESRPLVRIPCDQFARAAWSVCGAADTTGGRYAFGAVLIEVAGDECWTVASDGRRMYTCKIEHDQAVDEARVLVPVGAIELIAKIAGKFPEAAVQFYASGSDIVADIDVAVISVRLAAGEFPKWRKLIPKESGDATSITRTNLESATRAAAIVASESSRGVRYTFGGDTLLVEGKSSEAGESSVECAVLSSGSECRVKLNPGYVVDWLKELPLDAEPTVDVDARDGESAVVLRCGDHLAVVMPLSEDA